MSFYYGENYKIQIFGQSHAPAIGVVIEGVPAGMSIDMDALGAFLARRAPGKNEYSTARKEADLPEFISGINKNGTTCASPLTAIIRNTDTRSKDYKAMSMIPRPGHADYTAWIKYGEAFDHAGGGQFSGRMTAPMCIAGNIAMQILKAEGVEIITRIESIGGVHDEGELTQSTADKAFPTVSDECGEKMREKIALAKADGDSVGGVIECKILNLPAGLGDPMFGGMESRISSAVFGIPAVKGIEFGVGFDCADMLGSENNDTFAVENGKVVTTTNNCGGILGGITNAMPLTFRVALKPTPSISKTQRSVDLSKMENVELNIVGRHDPCIVPRAIPCVEAAAAIAVCDAYLKRKKELA